MLPKVSIVTPTLNAEKVLKPYLDAIEIQDYPKDLVELVIGDGGSTDKTLDILRKFGAKIFHNPLKTAESGKAVGVKNSTGEFIIQIDSDNIMPNNHWISDMVKPLIENPSAVAGEPWEYTWRRGDSFITRYCALIGMNDPLVHFLGNYDRLNKLTGMWTEIPHTEVDKGSYLYITFQKEHGLPTVGANGVVFRADFLKNNLEGDYLFDIDIMSKVLNEKGSLNFIKVKNGIIHTYCEANIGKFAKKQRRRVRDFLYHQSKGSRSYDWGSRGKIGKLLKFVFYCVTLVPLFFQSIYGYIKKPDPAWFFHPLACGITLWEYSIGYILGIFKKSEISRKNWSQ